ncbi:glycosyltransferase family 4 protein [Streptomyces sp. NPDC053499]|uniref:glycosyltransferase family 4 protein n=1 Tax=Streptomyces sp. NPDC053499 TaxID=3365707 RepID=UPI0037D63F4A
MKIVFLLDNAYGIGGTIRSTVNLSGALAERHEVEVVSLRRSRHEPALTFDPRVTLTSLIDLRPSSPRFDGDDPAYRLRSERFTEGGDHFERGISTRLGDLRVKELLENLEADVVIGTRPKINDYLAAYGTDRYVRIGQEHLTHAMHSDHIRTHQDAALAHLDAFVTVSYADAADYRAALPGVRTEIVCVPNAVPVPHVEPSDGQSKLVVAAGRLIKVKRYDRLLRAFALVADKHPDWSLRLYGRGPQQEALRAVLDELGLHDRAFLMGAHSPIETEWAKGAVAAVSSDAESFGMTLVEAMHCGVPVVSTDCPYGPGEIIANGVEGLLAPLGESEEMTVRAYADALLHLVEDPALRSRMSEAALRKAARYSPERIAGEYEELMTRLLAGRPGAGAAAAPSGTGPRTGTGTESRTGTSPDPRRSRRVPDGSGAQDPPSAPDARSPHAGRNTRAESNTPDEPSVQVSRPKPAARRTRLERAARRLVPSALRPALRPLARAVRGNGSTRQESAAKGLRRPVAHVRAEGDGTLLVRLRADSLPRSAAVLLLRPRHHDGDTPVRVPLPPLSQADGDGWVALRLTREEVHLFEARWDVFVERVSDGRSKRVKALMVETARLLSLPAPLAQDGTLQPWIPYATADGWLALRSWCRARHAEVTSIELGEHGFALSARLYGQPPGPALSRRTVELSGGPVLMAVPRDNPGQAFEFPGRRSTGDEGATVRLELPFELPAAFADGSPEGVWDLWLRPGLGPERVRLGRLLGDLADRKKTDVVPRVRLEGTDLAVQLYFSLNNNLVLALKTLAPHAAPQREPERASASTSASAPAPAPATQLVADGREPAAEGPVPADAQHPQRRSSSPNASPNASPSASAGA